MIKIGIIGYKRGKKLLEILKKTRLKLNIVAVYDNDKNQLLNIDKKIKTYNNFNLFLKNKDIQAVYIASPVNSHAHQTIKVLEKKKHVLCEVPAFKKIQDGKKIHKILKKEKKIYMMAENYCFLPQYLALYYLIKKKLFGEITFIRSSYIHDCRDLSFNKKNSKLTWRGRERLKLSGNDYPTHSIGPICKILGYENRNDYLKSISTFSNKENAMSNMYFKLFPKLKKKNYFKRPDTSISIIRTKKNKVIELICDTSSVRPHSMIDLYIQGTKMSYLSGRYDGEKPLISSSTKFNFSTPYKKFDFKKYLSKKDKRDYKKLGKNFSLYKVLENFQNTIEGKIKDPYINFDNAFLWSSIIEFSKNSLENNSSIIKFNELKN